MKRAYKLAKELDRWNKAMPISLSNSMFEAAEELRRLAREEQRLRDALAKAEQDAKRYRWLRDVGDATWMPFALREGFSAEKADAAIDEAMKRDKACSASG